ncbi:hypothetical protein RUM44_004434 [Polyplax serrata]|uniref:IPT/TIG domain-containing protein n=1 Tax=Polyplax serrata TaxID=468196 RepID=A0ABR1B2V0_POLSC
MCNGLMIVTESAKTGKLKISRINKCSGSVKGGDEIWMLVEKINKKGLVVKFWEECNGRVTWQSSLEGDDLILHHQYAIIFKMPPYRDPNIMSEVEVLMRLERTTQSNQPCDYSEPITFVYEPLKGKNNKGENLYRKESHLTSLDHFHIKRPRTDPSAGRLYGSDDDLEIPAAAFEDSTENYIEEILFSDKDTIELEQAWAKFNVEDDMDMPLQMDGIPFKNKHRRDLLYKLYILYSKLDENENKKPNEDARNFRRGTKDKMEGTKRSVEKEEVKDAASTLLSLRSRAMTGNCVSSNVSEPETNKKLRHAITPKRLPPFGESRDKSDVQAPLRTSVIKSHLLESRELNGSNFTDSQDIKSTRVQGLETELKEKFIISEMQPEDVKVGSLEDIPLLMNGKSIKKEFDSPRSMADIKKLDVICQILNESGSWVNLADMWDCSYIVPDAKMSPSPTKWILNYVENIHGSLELHELRYFLNASNEKKALEILDEMLTQDVR